MARAPSFWWQRPATWQAQLLRPLSALYGFVAGQRMRNIGTKAELPVICIGNFVAGGAGKTPTAIEICKIIKELDYRPVFLSRGYGGTETGPVLVQPNHTAAQIGDEPLLLNQFAPTIISADRVKGAQACAKHGDIIIMDDGFQNPSLHKDVALVVVDKTAGVGNHLCLPAGPLRAPLSTQLDKTDGLILIENQGESAHSSLPLLMGSFTTFEASADLKGAPEDFGPCIAYCAIGRPEKFFNAAQHAGFEIKGHHRFADHHTLSDTEAQHLLDEAQKLNAKLITTHKDKVRLKGAQSKALNALYEASTALDLMFNFKDRDALKKFIAAHLAPNAQHH